MRKAKGLPAGLEGLRRRFERSRRMRKARARIPDPLWAAAVKMAGIHGMNRTAKTLRLDYYALKRRVGLAKPVDSDEPKAGGFAPFVELTPLARCGACECTVELEQAGEAKMRMHLTSVEMPDLAALSRSFWDRQS